jgi:hypothetical protein
VRFDSFRARQLFQRLTQKTPGTEVRLSSH